MGPSVCATQLHPTDLAAEIDPLQKGGQGEDVGSQYRTGIYSHGEEQAQVSGRQEGMEEARASREAT